MERAAEAATLAKATPPLLQEAFLEPRLGNKHGCSVSYIGLQR